MPTLRRLTALLSGLLLLQLTLPGADWSCGSHARPVERARAEMPAGHAAHEASRTQPPGDACDAEHAPTDCATMPSCAAALGSPARLVTVVALAPASDAIPEPVPVHSQPATGPDVPPPRG